MSSPAHAAQHWISVSTSHFEMYTTNNQKQAIRSLQGFEQVRYFFLQANKNAQEPEGRVRIIAFSSESEFKPYRLNSGSFAYYLRSHEHDYIVMQDISADHHQAAVHEYTHLVIQHMKLELPIWLNEGLADLYSSLEPNGQKAMVGRPLGDRLVILNDHPWMDWNLLFSVDRHSPYYNERDKMSIFYAQSWALTHMLRLGPSYSANFPKFLSAVASGMATPDALQKIYGKSVKEIGKAVQSYIRQASVRAFVYDVKLSKLDLDPQVSDLTPFQSRLALAQLLLARPESAGQAKEELLALEQQNPNSVELQEARGYLAWQEHNIPETCRYFQSAVDHGSENVQMIFQYAQLLLGSAPSSAETSIKLLEKVIALEPDNNDARIFLAQAAAHAGRYATALSAVAPIHNVQPDQAFQLFSVSAFVHAHLKDYDGAKTLAQKALPYAKSPGQRLQMENLMNFVDQAANPRLVRANSYSSINPPKLTRVEPPLIPDRDAVLVRKPALPRVQGQMMALECSKTGPLRLRIQSGDRQMVFAMPDPKDILVHGENGAVTIDLQCGPLKQQNVTVVYKPAGELKADGIVAELIF
ncbi:MAG TPA: tetratricopeptide repeat protein [Bryobacteraceae bacterium]|nr:tetratricopeptide repeat protein [Bryobacteraceae bacterium]